MNKSTENYISMQDRWFMHAHQRAMERYGFAYTDIVREMVLKDVKNHVFNELCKVPGTTRVVYRGRILGIVATFLFDEKHKAVVTFLHNNWMQGSDEEFYILTENERKRTSRHKHEKKASAAAHGTYTTANGVKRKRKAPKPNHRNRRTEPKDYLDEGYSGE